MGYGDDSLALKLSLKKKARNERRLRRSQAKDDKNIKLSTEEKTGALRSKVDDINFSLDQDTKAGEGKDE